MSNLYIFRKTILIEVEFNPKVFLLVDCSCLSVCLSVLFAIAIVDREPKDYLQSAFLSNFFFLYDLLDYTINFFIYLTLTVLENNSH